MEDIKPVVPPFTWMWGNALEVTFTYNQTMSLLENVYALYKKVQEVTKSQNDLIQAMKDFLAWADTQLEGYAKDQLNQWLTDGTLEELINDVLLNNKVDKTVFNEFVLKVEQIAYSLDNFPRLAGETNDKGRFDRAIAQLPVGSTLLIPAKEYAVNGDIVLNRQVSLKGQSKPYYNESDDTMINGTVLRDSKIVLKTNNINIEKLGILSTSVDNGIEGSQGATKDIRISDVVVRVRSHGFLFESYEGVNEDILVRDCQTYKSTHGFVSKALNVTFENCFASGHAGGYAFAAISDNIQGPNKKSIANHNTFNNCYAKNSDRGFTFYNRDMFSLNNANGIVMRWLKVMGCTAENCLFPLMLGDINPEEGQSRNAIGDFIVDSFTELGTTSNYSIRLGYAINGIINSPILTKYIAYDQDKTSRVDINEYHGDRQNPMTYNMRKLPVNNNVPRLDCNGNDLVFHTANTAATAIRGFNGSLRGVNITIMIDDDFTSILSDDLNIRMSQPVVGGKGSYVTLKYDGNNWNEVFIYNAPSQAPQVVLTSNGNVDTGLGTLFDVVGTGSTSNVINAINTFKPELTLIIRSTSGSFTYGGFGSRFLANDLPRTLAFGEVIIASFAYIKAINKYGLIGYTKNNL